MTAPVLSAVRHVVGEYKRFLRTSYRFHDEHLQQVDVVMRGPLVTLTCDFRMGQPLRALAEEGVVSRDLLRAHWPFGEDRLYEHQEHSLRIGAAGRSFLVTPLLAIRRWHAWTNLTTGSLASGAGPPGLEALVFLNNGDGGLSRPPSRVW